MRAAKESRMPKYTTLALYRTSRRWSEADARQVLAALDESGMSTAAFAMEKGLDPQRLYWWRRRLANADTDAAVPAFLELTPDVLKCEHVEVTLRSGRILRFSPKIDTAVLQQLVTALEQDAC